MRRLASVNDVSNSASNANEVTSRMALGATVEDRGMDEWWDNL